MRIGASAEGGEHDSFDENLYFNLIDPGVANNLKHLDDGGSVRSFPNHSWGWAWAGNTHLRRGKRHLHGGCTDCRPTARGGRDILRPHQPAGFCVSLGYRERRGGTHGGLPQGVLLIGARCREDMLRDAAKAIERRTSVLPTLLPNQAERTRQSGRAVAA